MVQKLRSTAGAIFRPALVLVGWAFFALAQVTPEPLFKLLFALIARVLESRGLRVAAQGFRRAGSQQHSDVILETTCCGNILFAIAVEIVNHKRRRRAADF